MKTKRNAKASSVEQAPERFTGIVRWFSKELGYGFICPSRWVWTKINLPPDKDLYFLAADFLEWPNVDLMEFELVSFRVEQGSKGLRAVALQCVVVPKVKPPPVKKYPQLCEDELEEVTADWGIEKRQALGEKFARWGNQLCFSSDMMKRFGPHLDEEPELVFPSNELAAALHGKTRSQCLAEAAKFEEWCATIRQMLGVKRQAVSATVSNSN